MKNAVVTGANGFVGRHLARVLAREGYGVSGIGHGVWTRDEWRLWGVSEFYLCDVTIESLVTYAGKPDVIFHCAGSGSVAFSTSHPYQDYQRTVATTHAALEFIRIYCPDTPLVIPSSAGVYGTVERMPIKVCGSLNPASPYGLHKKIAEDLCRSYGTYFGIRSALVRLFSVYGIGLRKQLLWDACHKISAGSMTFAGTGQETRDWLHVEDAADLLLEAAKHATKHSPVVNGGTGEAVAIADVIGAVAQALSSRQSPEFSGVGRLGDPKHYQADITEADAWGWRPKREWQAEVGAYARWFKQGAP